MTVDPVAQPVAGQAQPTVHLDLDVLERDDINTGREPYRVNVAGRLIEFTDPMELDIDVVLAMSENPFLVKEYALSVEDREHINKQSLPTWKALKLLKGYQDYWNLEELAKNLA